MACGHFAFGRAREAPVPFGSGIARPSPSRRGVVVVVVVVVVVGFPKTRLRSMSSSGLAGAGSGNAVESARQGGLDHGDSSSLQRSERHRQRGASCQKVCRPGDRGR